MSRISLRKERPKIGQRVVYVPGKFMHAALQKVDHELHWTGGKQVRQLDQKSADAGDLAGQQRLSFRHDGPRHPPVQTAPLDRHEGTARVSSPPHPLTLQHRPQTADRGALLRLHIRNVRNSHPLQTLEDSIPTLDSQEESLHWHRQLPPVGRTGLGLLDRLR